MNPIQRLKAYLTFQEAVKQADKAHQKTGKRHYVMPTTDGRLIIIDRKTFRRMKSKHYISDKAKVQDLMAECFYFTAHPNGDGETSQMEKEIKRKQYAAYCEAFHKRNSMNRKVRRAQRWGALKKRLYEFLHI